jgi:hypothetical protein
MWYVAAHPSKAEEIAVMVRSASRARTAAATQSASSSSAFDDEQIADVRVSGLL